MSECIGCGTEGSSHYYVAGEDGQSPICGGCLADAYLRNRRTPDHGELEAENKRLREKLAVYIEQHPPMGGAEHE